MDKNQDTVSTVLVTGAGGQVGRALQEIQEHFPGLRLLAAGRDQLDLADPNAARRFLHAHTVDFCIHAAAYTAVDRAESEPEMAHRVNAAGSGYLAAACAEAGAPLIYLSSDYVYHNTLNRPLREDDPTTPKGVYARAKLAGEQLAREAQPQTMIVRTSWVYSPFGSNFVHTMLRLGRQRPDVSVVYDQIGAPTYAHDLARALLTIIEQAAQGNIAPDRWAAIYNYANEGVTSWYDFAVAIFEESGVNCRVFPIESKDYPTPAQRPSFSVLNKEKIKTNFGLTIPHWRQSLRHCLKRL